MKNNEDTDMPILLARDERLPESQNKGQGYGSPDLQKVQAEPAKENMEGGKVRKKTSIVVDEKLWNDFRVHCVKQNVDSSAKMEELIKKELRK